PLPCTSLYITPPPVSSHLPYTTLFRSQSCVLHAGGLRGAADPAGPESPGEPRPGRARGGPAPRCTDEGRHRVPGPRAGRVAAGQTRRAPVCTPFTTPPPHPPSTSNTYT